MYYNGENDQIIRDLTIILGSLNPVSIVVPLNEREEKQRWVEAAKAGKILNPSFTYDDVLLKTAANLAEFLRDSGRQIMSSMRSSGSRRDSFTAYLLKHMLKEYSAVTALAKAIMDGDDFEATKASLTLFGRPSKGSVAAAKTASLQPYVAPVSGSEPTMGALDIAVHFEEAISELGISGWEVKLDDHRTAIDVCDQTSTILIPRDKKISTLKLAKLTYHEINSHLRGSANCRALVSEILGSDSPLLPLVPWLAKSTNEVIYEGAAKLSDAAVQKIYTDSENGELPKWYYLLASDFALAGHNFSETATYILGLLKNTGMPENKAIGETWITCRRLFRGARHPELAGYAFPKDYGYFEGYHALLSARPKFRALCLDYSTLQLATLKQYSTLLGTFTPKYKSLTLP